MINSWPFILLLPANLADQYDVLASAFKSKIALEILKEMKIDGKTYQKEIVKKLREHSNKSVLRHLMRFVEAGILDEGMERVKVDNRRVWNKWYEPTFMGKWFILLLTPREKLSPEKIEGMLREFISYYARSIAKICSYYNLDAEYLREVFNESLRDASKKGFKGKPCRNKLKVS